MIKKLSVVTLLLLTALSVWFIAGLSDVRFDYDFEKFFPADDPETQFFNQYRETFGSDNDFIIIGLANDGGIFEQSFLTQLAALTDSLKTASHVTHVTSPTNIKQLRFDPLFDTPIERPYLRFDQPEHYAQDSTRIFEQPGLVGSIFSPNGKAVAVFVKTENYISKKKADVLSADLDRIFSHFDFDEVHIAGRAPGQAYYVELLQNEFILFISLSIVLITVFLVIAFRSFWGVWVPLLVVLMAVVWTVGLLAHLGKPLGIMLNILPVIIFVVGVSDVVHLVTRYFEVLRSGAQKMQALKTAFREVGFATFLTSLTTGIGFLTLTTSPIVPINEFGLYTAIGILLAFILAFTLLPSVLALSKVPSAVHHPTNKYFWEKQLRKLFGLVIRRRSAILFASAGVLLVSLVGVSLIKSDNFLLEDLRESDPMKQQFRFLEENFGGVRPFEMHLTAGEDANIWDFEVLREIDKLSSYLDTAYGVQAQISALQVVKSLNQATHNGKVAHYKLPDTPEQYQKLTRKMDIAEQSGMLRAVVSTDGKYGRIGGRIPDLGNVAVSKLDQKLADFYAAEINPELLRYRLTGTSVLIDINNEALSTNMVYGLLIAFGVIAIIMGVLFKSLRMVLITLIPNILPLLMIAAIMGYFGITLKVSTSIIFTIAFGIAVDDTIHFMSKLKLELMKGKSIHYAIKRTFFSTGKAIVVTSIILCAGFILLIGSEFLGTFYIGLLISMMLLFAVLSDLLLLPALLFYFYPKKK